MYNNPKIFSTYVAEEIKSLYPNLTLAASGEDIRKPPWQSLNDVTTSNGVTFKTFAKAAKFDKGEFYINVVYSLEVSKKNHILSAVFYKRISIYINWYSNFYINVVHFIRSILKRNTH